MWRSFSWRVSMSGIERWRGLARPSRLLAAGLVTLGVAGIALAADAAVSEGQVRSEEHTSVLQSLMRISYAVFCLKKKKKNTTNGTDKGHKLHNKCKHYKYVTFNE